MTQRAYIRTVDGEYEDHDFYGLASLGDVLNTELQIRVTKCANGTAYAQLIVKDDHGDTPVEAEVNIVSTEADLLIRVLGGDPSCPPQ